MNCLRNISSTLYKADLVKKLTDLYMHKGKDFYYEDVLKAYLNGIIQETIEKDTEYASRLLNLKISDSRRARIVKGNSSPKTKDEILLSNLKKVFTTIQKKGTKLYDDLDDNELLRLAISVFEGVDSVKYASYEVLEENSFTLYPEKVRKYKREEINEAIRIFKNGLYKSEIEATNLITAFYVDLIHMDCFTGYNDFLALLILYALLFGQRFNVFKYESFFELYYKNIDKFKVVTASAGLNWETGYSNITMLNTEIIDLMLLGYSKTDYRINDVKFDKAIKKIDNVESAVMKLPQTFTRKDIKDACPRLSDSTINRALENLKAENKIRSNGTGRSATWTKLVENESFQSRITQMSIDDVIED